ncbi:MAG TPA: YqaJ viral recombinase family protein [Polyangiaceae bacterium]|jgi:hypothetical protein|nr:YqaJ viral recombinase family protein [Xanthobacteraceae bacterium]HEX2672851.1 YqaJ viral recombinase family protein [Polyangiaceae bacterium]
MTIFDFPQKSDAWYEARRGVPTCSAFDKIITAAKGEPSKSQEKLINELLAEALCPTFGPGYQSADMDAGAQMEKEARAFYELDAGVTVREVGFILSDCGRFGGSPDGLVNDDGGLELKCPSASVQISYIRDAVLPLEYKAQVHGYLVLTGRPWWDFESYYSELPAFRVRVERDDFTAKLEKEVKAFCERHAAARAKFGLPKLGGTK